jgi:hypothetical protein
MKKPRLDGEEAPAGWRRSPLVGKSLAMGEVEARWLGNDHRTCKNDRPLVVGYRVVEVGVGRETLQRTASFVSVFTAFGPV